MAREVEVTMMAVLVSLCFVLLQARPNDGFDELIGQWSTTVVPPRGEAPMMAPSFSVERKDGKLIVSIEGYAPQEAISYQAVRGQMYLVVRIPPAKGRSEMYIVRPVSGEGVQLELFVEYSSPGSKQSNFHYTEQFKRIKAGELR